MSITEIAYSEFSKEKFLKDYWQKKPLLIRAFLPENLALISPEELAGLACEEGIESRIVRKSIEQGRESWSLEHGPFEEYIFEELPDKSWTLLVQSVDHWNHEVNELLTPFRFLPAHILDDIMVSFAPKGGGVGPHFDYYDVFLVQGLGSREWRIGQECDENTSAKVSKQLLILDEFIEQQNFVLHTGDVLYLPPKLAHWGTALEDCITYSVGFRTPSLEQSIIAFTDTLCEELKPSERLVFPLAADPFQIDTQLIGAVKQQIEKNLLNDKKLLRWYGCFATEAKNENSILALAEKISIHELMQLITSGEIIYKNEGSRFIYAIGECVSIFVDGKHYPLDKALENFAKLLCEKWQFDLAQMGFLDFVRNNNSLTNLLLELVNNGSLYFEEV
jgi:50S ribosomal protein L16 3-hydroxylase